MSFKIIQEIVHNTVQKKSKRDMKSMFSKYLGLWAPGY